MQKPKRSPKTKEQILAEMKNNKNFKEKIAFVREVFYPALMKATDNVEQAGEYLGALNSLLMQQFLKKMQDISFKDMNIPDLVNKEDPQYEPMKAMLTLLEDKTVFEAKDIMEGVKGEIDLFKRDYFKKMKLDQLPAVWIDQM